MGKLLQRRAESGVLYTCLDIGGKLFSRGHHDSGRSHGNAVQYDHRVGVDPQDPVDPGDEIKPVVIAVSDISSFALAVPAKIRQHNVHAVQIVVNSRELSYALRGVRIAVHADRIAVIASVDRSRDEIGVNAKAVFSFFIPVAPLRVGIHPYAALCVRQFIGFFVPAGIVLYRLHRKVVKIVRDSDHRAGTGPQSCLCHESNRLAQSGLLLHQPFHFFFRYLLTLHCVKSLHLPVTAASYKPSP